MRSFVTCTMLASVASLAAAAGLQSSWEYPEGVPVVEKRQEPGTPRYACHENCGTLITLGRTEGYCDTSEWSTRYAACMACANEFGIWMYYSSGVTPAAEECGLSPTPSPSGAAAETTAAAATTNAATPAPTESAAEPVATSTSTAAAGVATTLTTATAASSATASGTSAATVTRATSIGTSVVIPSGSPTPSTVFAGASKNSGVLGAIGVVGLVLAAL